MHSTQFAIREVGLYEPVLRLAAETAAEWTDGTLVLVAGLSGKTAQAKEEAERIARGLVDTGVAACVNIVPGLRSIYRWKGNVEDSSELLLVIKTKRELFARLQTELRRLHSYEVPELIALPIVDGLDEYLGWIDRQTGGGDIR